MNHAAPFQALIARGGEAKPPSGPQHPTRKRHVISAQEQRTRVWDTGIPTACEAGVASSPGGPRRKDLLQVGLGTCSNGVNTMLTILQWSPLCFFCSSPSTSIMASHLDCRFGGVQQEKGRRLDTGSLNQLQKPGEEPACSY